MRLSKQDEIKAKELSLKYNLSYEEVKAIIYSQFDFIRTTIKEINFEEGLTEEEFNSMKTNFNIPGIGKLHASYYIYSKINEHNKNGRKKSSDKDV